MGSYVDTTVVVEAAKQTVAWTQHFEPHLIGKPPAQVPHYAFREFSAGALRTIATAHNQLSQATNPAEALQQILRLPSFVGRTKDGQLKAFAQVLGPALNQSGSPDQAMFIGVRRSMCQSLAVMAEREWRRAKNEPALAKIQELACFGTGELDIQDGLLVGPEAGRWE